jgi:hypothetical protein
MAGRQRKDKGKKNCFGKSNKSEQFRGFDFGKNEKKRMGSAVDMMYNEEMIGNPPFRAIYR